MKTTILMFILFSFLFFNCGKQEVETEKGIKEIECFEIKETYGFVENMIVYGAKLCPNKNLDSYLNNGDEKEDALVKENDSYHISLNILPKNGQISKVKISSETLSSQEIHRIEEVLKNRIHFDIKDEYGTQPKYYYISLFQNLGSDIVKKEQDSLCLFIDEFVDDIFVSKKHGNINKYVSDNFTVSGSLDFMPQLTPNSLDGKKLALDLYFNEKLPRGNGNLLAKIEDLILESNEVCDYNKITKSTIRISDMHFQKKNGMWKVSEIYLGEKEYAELSKYLLAN